MKRMACKQAETQPGKTTVTPARRWISGRTPARLSAQGLTGQLVTLCEQFKQAPNASH